MLDDVFLGLVRADFIKAIEKHAKAANVGSEDIQIQIKLDDEKGLAYSIFQSWKQSKPDCSFKEVMCIKLDIFGKEGMLAPHIHEKLQNQLSIYNCESRDFCTFLFIRNKTIGCALYVGNKPVRTCLLADLFT